MVGRAGLVLSALGHVAMFWGLGLLPAPEAAIRALTEVRFEVLEPEPAPEPPEPEPETPPPEPAPEPEPEAPPPPPPTPRTTPRAPPPDEPPPDQAPPPPAEETPVAFDNVVLTNEGPGAGWAVQQGSGVERDGPMGAPGAAVTGRSRQGVAGGTPGGTGTAAPAGPTVVAVSDLSRRPNPPPDLGARLSAAYPPAARRQGVEGEATVRIRIDPNGTVRVLGVVAESFAGFAEACRATLLRAPRWTAPLDRNGSPVATVTRFRCEFTFDY